MLSTQSLYQDYQRRLPSLLFIVNKPMLYYIYQQHWLSPSSMYTYIMQIRVYSRYEHSSTYHLQFAVSNTTLCSYQQYQMCSKLYNTNISQTDRYCVMSNIIALFSQQPPCVTDAVLFTQLHYAFDQSHCVVFLAMKYSSTASKLLRAIDMFIIYTFQSVLTRQQPDI